MTPRSRSTAKGVAAVLVASLPFTIAGVARPTSSLKDEDGPPQGLPECATEADLKYQPVLDFDKDGCYNTAGIDIDGNLNPGLWNCYTTGEADCRDESDLDSQNVYSRARCNNGWCAYMYDYYFEKDVALEQVCGVGAGHRHDWEHIVVFVEGDQVRYLATSAHGNWDTRSVDDARMDGDRVKVVYHKDGPGTHAFRHAHEQDDDVENHKGEWFRGPLISHYGWPSGELRNKMYDNDWGKANINLRDPAFSGALEKAKGGNNIPLDTESDDDQSPGQPSCSA